MKCPTRVLLIDDHPEDRALVVRELRRVLENLQVTEITEAAAFEEALAGEDFDLVITDFKLHWSDGLKVVGQIKGHRPGCPVIMITGAGSEEIAVAAMKAGVDDYINKSFQYLQSLAKTVRFLGERNREQQARRQADARYARLFELVPVGLYRITLGGEVLDANLALAELLGYGDREAFLTVNAREFYAHDEDRHRWRQLMERDGAVRNFETQLRRRDGRVIWVRNNAQAVRDEGGRIVWYEGSAEDITARKQAEMELQETNEFLRSLLQASAAAIVYLDRQGNVRIWNRAASQMFGWDAEEVRGGPLPCIPRDRQREFQELRERALRGEALTGVEVQRHKKDGSLIDVSLSLAPVQDAQGEVQGTLAIITDITQRKQAEEALHQKEEQFQQAQKMEAVGRLAGGVAHDFNNLLTAILGYSELLQMSGLEQEQSSMVVQIMQVCERAATLVRQLLALSRRQSIRPVPLDLNKVVEDMEQILQRVIGEDILLNIHLEPGRQGVKADRGQLEQVIVNLVVNARDAMPGGGDLYLRTYQATLDDNRLGSIPGARPGTFVVLEVADSGLGIEKKVRERIFEPFFTTKGPGEGTGLGLSTVYGIVRQHEGWINVTSEPGRGASFKIYLPLASIKPEKRSLDVLSLQELKGRGERILVVEDEDELRQIALRMLRGKGYWVAGAADVAGALAVFEKAQGNFQLLFSDVVLSDQSGLRLVEELLARKPDLRVLLTSGYADEKVQWPIIQAKRYPFLQKPYSLKDLLKNIAAVLKSGEA